MGILRYSPYLVHAERVERARRFLKDMADREIAIRRGMWLGDDGVLRVGRSGDFVTMLDDLGVQVRA